MKGCPVRLRNRLAALKPELLAYATSLVRAADEAEDLVHDAIVRALQASSAPREMAELRPWMFRVIKNLFIDRTRKQRVQREYSAVQDRFSDVAAAGASDVVEALMVRQAYVGLEPSHREVLCLIDILGFTYAETAAMIDVPVGTVMSRVSRARRAMIARMGETNVRPLRSRKG